MLRSPLPIEHIVNSKQRNSGFVLVTSLIFLTVLSLLVIVAVRNSLFDERMASSDRDMALARENAELALRDAERDILGLRFDGSPNFCSSAVGPACTTIRPAGTRPVNVTDTLTFWSMANPVIDDIALDDGGVGLALNRQGMYTAQSSTACGMPIWSGANWQDGASPARSCLGTINAAVPTIAYGTFTNAAFPPGNAPNNILTGVPPPRYMIELFKSTEMRLSNTSNKIFFRITAVGFGRTTGSNGARTSVTLQTVFSPS